MVLITMNSIRRQIQTSTSKLQCEDISARRKMKNKIQLQKDLGLEQDPKAMMIGIVSRLTDQKGFDLIAYVMDELCQDAVQIVALGTGEMNAMRICSVTLTGNITARYLHRSTMMRQCLTEFMQHLTHS